VLWEPSSFFQRSRGHRYSPARYPRRLLSVASRLSQHTLSSPRFLLLFCTVSLPRCCHRGLSTAQCFGIVRCCFRRGRRLLFVTLSMIKNASKIHWLVVFRFLLPLYLDRGLASSMSFHRLLLRVRPVGPCSSMLSGHVARLPYFSNKCPSSLREPCWRQR
jgi:hypothetical protein